MGMRLMPMAVLSAVLVAAVVSAGCQAQPAQPVQAAQPAPGAPAGASPFLATSSIRELMQSMVAPSAQGLWDSVGRVSDAKGTRDIEPRTDEEWAAVRRHAVSLMESTNLLMMTGRHVAKAGERTNKADDADPGAELPPAMIEKRINQDWPAWLGMAQALHASAASMLDAVDKKDVRRLESTGSDLDGVCEACHLTFWYPPRQAR
jgi:hypothetical protein